MMPRRWSVFGLALGMLLVSIPDSGAAGLRKGLDRRFPQASCAFPRVADLPALTFELGPDFNPSQGIELTLGRTRTPGFNERGTLTLEKLAIVELGSDFDLGRPAECADCCDDSGCSCFPNPLDCPGDDECYQFSCDGEAQCRERYLQNGEALFDPSDHLFFTDFGGGLALTAPEASCETVSETV